MRRRADALAVFAEAFQRGDSATGNLWFVRQTFSTGRRWASPSRHERAWSNVQHASLSHASRHRGCAFTERAATAGHDAPRAAGAVFSHGFARQHAGRH
jgi:hypothetical protein